jgi:uncharacterized protein (TIGR02996 family)
MTERERLLRAVEANPGDNATLLAYAEWLDTFARSKGRIKAARTVTSIRGFLDLSNQVALRARAAMCVPPSDPISGPA